MTINTKEGKITLTWSWGGQLVLTPGGARLFVRVLLDAIGDSEKQLQVEKQL